MKILLLIFFTSFSIFSQDFESIKKITDDYSGRLTAEELAKHISTDFSSDETKVKALFTWLTKNIRYDLEAFYNPKNRKTSFKYRNIEEKNKILQDIKDKTVHNTLSSRKGVCEGYAQTFAKVSTLLKIENEVIKGYARASFHDIGKPKQQPNHAWNAVKIDNHWIYIDATWGAGHQTNGKWIHKFKPYYFDINKGTYFKSHLPEDTKWILEVGRIDKTTFYDQPIYSDYFLTTNYKLISPNSGFLKRDNNAKVTIVLENIKIDQQIHYGFLNSKFAQKANTTFKNGTTTVTISIPKETNEVFLMIDKKFMLYFNII